MNRNASSFLSSRISIEKIVFSSRNSCLCRYRNVLDIILYGNIPMGKRREDCFIR